MFFRAMVRIFSFGERWSVPFNSADASLNGTFHLSPHENILTIALINIHYLYNIFFPCTNSVYRSDMYTENICTPNVDSKFPIFLYSFYIIPNNDSEVVQFYIRGFSYK
jgi:hypothetical protein